MPLQLKIFPTRPSTHPPKRSIGWQTGVPFS
jgi:hypothetical protein